MLKLEELEMKDKKVIIRCDFNVPMKDGVITSDARIVAALETIQYCIDKGAKVILMSHLGKIKTKEDKENPKHNLASVAVRLSELLGRDVTFVDQTRGEELENAVAGMQAGSVLLMQNTRFEDVDEDVNVKKESKNDDELAKYWASLGDLFINDAFGTTHREHASNYGIAKYLPSAFGKLVEKEVSKLQELINPEHPFIAVLGGGKVADKISVIENLAPKADKILIGGGMAFTFLKAAGVEVGQSLVDEANLEFCKRMIEEYGDKIVLPIDVRTGKLVGSDVRDAIDTGTKTIREIAPEEAGLDIGPETEKMFEEYLSTAAIGVWNGPLGAYENENYKKGTDRIVKYIADNGIKVILGGGDVVAAAGKYKDSVYHASTGGGATLEFIGGTSPLINVISQSEDGKVLAK